MKRPTAIIAVVCVVIVVILIGIIAVLRYKSVDYTKLTFAEQMKLAIETNRHTDMLEKMVINAGDTLKSLVGTNEEGKNIVETVLCGWRYDGLKKITGNSDKAHNRKVYEGILVSDFLLPLFQSRGVEIHRLNAHDKCDYIIYYYPIYLDKGGKTLLADNDIESLFRNIA